MSTQDDSAILFDICHDQQSLRLLELPPALMEMITSSHPPSLSLKSGALDVKSTSSIASNHAVLCTFDRTFHIRQVHSSNSIFLLQPSPTNTTFEEASIALQGVSAIAQPTSTLELIPSSFPGRSILRRILPVCNATRIESEGNPGPALADRISKFVALESVPLSSAEFEASWIQLCAFESEGQAWLPTATLLARVWNSILSVATAESLDLEQSFRIQVIADLVREDGYPIPVVEAIARRLHSNGHDLMDGYAVIDKDECVIWVGVTVLEAQSDPEGAVISDFLLNWKNQLPETWREYVTLEVIKGKYRHAEKGRIAFDNGTNMSDPSSSSPAANASGKRPGKWHEKFKNARR